MARCVRPVYKSLLAFCFAAVGCAEKPGGRADAPTVHDSAGVQIVENPDFVVDSAWYADSVPALVIGNDDSRSEEYLFGRIVSAVRLDDGRIVVADGQAVDIRVFDRSGAFLNRIGRKGRGPGEFRGVSQLYLVSDTVIVRSPYDGDPISYFESNGTFVRSWQLLPGQHGDPNLDAFFADGSFLLRVSRSRNPRFHVSAPRVPTVIDLPERLVRVTPTGDTTDFGFYSVERSIFYSNHPLPGLEITAPAYLPQPQRVTSSTHLYVTNGDRFEVQVYDSAAQLRRIIRKQHRLATISPKWADSAWHATIARFSKSEIAPWISTAPAPPVPSQVPAIHRLAVDPSSNLWVGAGRLDATKGRTWFVFDSTGVLRRSLYLPIDPMQIGLDYVLAATRNSNDVWQLAVYRLFKHSR